MAWEDVLDPMAWLAGIGTGSNLYTNYQNDAAMQAYNAQIQQYLAANAQQQAMYNQMAMMYPQMWMQANQADMGLRMPLIGGLSQLAGAPMPQFDPLKYMQQLSEQEKMAILRPPSTAMAARGFQPGGYWDAVVANTLAGDAESRYSQGVTAATAAENSAIQQRQMQIEALRGALGGIPGFSAPPQPIPPSLLQAPQPPLMPAVGQDPLSNYLRTLKIQNAPQAPVYTPPPTTSSSGDSGFSSAGSGGEDFPVDFSE